MYYLTEVVIWQKMAVFILCIDLILVTRRIRNWKRIGGVRESDRERGILMLVERPGVSNYLRPSGLDVFRIYKFLCNL